MEMPAWWIFAIAASVAAAVNGGMNRYFRCEGARLTLWAVAVQVAVLSPALWLAAPPSALFVLMAVAAGLLFCVFDVTLYAVAARYGGPVIPRVLALRIWILFFVWACIDPAYTQGLFAHPGVAVGVLAALGAGSVCLFLMTRCHLTRAAFMALMPTLAASVVIAILVKLALADVAADGLGPVALFKFIASAAELPAAAAWIWWRRARRGHAFGGPVFDRAFIAPALVIGLSSACVGLTRMGAIALAPNPAYVYMVALLSAVWLWAAHAALRIPDNREPWAGLGLVASAGALIYLTA